MKQRKLLSNPRLALATTLILLSFLGTLFKSKTSKAEEPKPKTEQVASSKPAK